MPTRRTGGYASGTSTTVDASRGEITGILAKHGVLRMGWSTAPEGDELLFELQGGQYRFSIRRPTAEETKALWERAGGKWSLVDHEQKIADEWRRRWRANVLLLKAKLEFALADSTLDRELLPYRVLASGHTVEEALLSGVLPALLPAGVKKS